MRIGLSFDHGTPKYRLYLGALMAAAEFAEMQIVPVWLAGRDQRLEAALLGSIDGLVLTGGPDVDPRRYGFTGDNEHCKTDPKRDALEWEMLDSAFGRRLPILAICRGMQLLNVYRGGTLIPDLPTSADHRLRADERHLIQIEPGSTLARLAQTSEAEVTSSHHQAVDRVGHGLQAVAWHGDRTIEALAWSTPMRKPWLMAVQWHPERMAPTEALAGPLYHGFLQAVTAAAILQEPKRDYVV